MERENNRPQQKEQEKSPETELNERGASNLSDTDFKVMVIRKIKGLRTTIAQRRT